MKTIFFFMFLMLFAKNVAIAEEYPINSAEEITYDLLEKLGRETGYTDSIPHIRELLNHLKVKSFLEFGVGYSTKYLLDHCNKVISVEFITAANSPIWIHKCLNLYKNYANWVPIVYFSNYHGDIGWAPYKYRGSEHVFKADSFQIANHRSYASIDDFYLTELNAFVISLVKCHKIDAALVDPGIYLRGDLVQLLFGKVAVIVAHDTPPVCNTKAIDDLYGYTQIVVPDDYEEIFFPQGQGTTMWILKKKELEKLILTLKQYARSLSR